MDTLRDRLIRTSLSQSRLAELAGVSRATVAGVIYDNVETKPESLRKLLDLLDRLEGRESRTTQVFVTLEDGKDGARAILTLILALVILGVVAVFLT